MTEIGRGLTLTRSEQVTIPSNIRLISVHAPAGYGKTTYVKHLLRMSEHVTWYSLTPLDNDNTLFFEQFLSSVQTGLQHLLPHTFNQLNESTNVKRLCRELIKELAELGQSLILVIDNFHLISQRKIHDFINQILHSKTHHLTLCIIGRVEPAVHSAPLKINGELIHIDRNSLTLSEKDIDTFLTSNYPSAHLTHEDTRLLSDYCRGWISPLILIMDDVARDPALLKLAHQEGIHKLHCAALNQYIESEIFSLFRRGIGNLCLQLTLLPQFSQQQLEFLCQLNGLNAEKVKDELMKLDLIERNKEQIHRYHFHPLFRQYCDVHRLAHHSARSVILLSQAVDSLVNENLVVEAVQIAIKYELNEKLLSLIENAGWTLLNNLNFVILKQALETIPNQTQRNRELNLLSLWLAVSLGHESQVEDKLNDNQAHNDWPHGDHEYTAQINVLKAHIALTHDQVDTAMTCAEDALINLDHASYRARCIATSITGKVNQLYGRLEQALSLMQQTERYARQYRLPEQILSALIQQSEIYLAKGLLSTCEDTLNKASDLMNDYHFPCGSLYHKLMTKIRTELYIETGDLTKARKWIQESLKADESPLLRICLAKTELLLQRQQDLSSTLIQCPDPSSSEIHPEWQSYTSEVFLFSWAYLKENQTSITHWLSQANKLSNPINHFSQRNHRNIALAYLYSGDLSQSEQLLTTAITNAKDLGLYIDLYRDLVLRAHLYSEQSKDDLALEEFKQAIKLSSKLNCYGYYLLFTPWVEIFVDQCLNDQSADFTRIELHHLERINTMLEVSSNNIVEPSQMHASQLSSRIIQYQEAQGAALTQREVSILCLIYSGWKNDEIANSYDIAPSTVKTHIRNLYQKLGVINRKQAKQLVDTILNSR
ncbi:LuxR C-terminal-related transcriptional regulator [Vibrio viridaestus]|uniref:HTH luxR-type domain-containing protein n=1 Tax=Vibrio viridaestus TaxID=2487322 RepID=A0A3N9TN01_9VIBR|nr:LuxR C-terminal-related transcriptional regulator [Vibrio viridaestus]RQW65025.1 hypothetical protein EES38_03055 [Vibrio viridaestus]